MRSKLFRRPALSLFVLLLVERHTLDPAHCWIFHRGIIVTWCFDASQSGCAPLEFANRNPFTAQGPTSKFRRR
jgi:hypothetical protein